MTTNTNTATIETQTETTESIDLTAYTTTSAKIRYLTAQGWSRSKIANHLGIRYQHVRNVQITPIKKS